MSGRNRTTFSTGAAEMLAVAMIGAAFLGPAAAAEKSPVLPPEASTEIGNPLGEVDGEDLSKLLPLLLTSSERKELARQLEATIRRGDMKDAETRLNTAIDMGTLAIVLIDRLKDPSLLPALQKLGIRGDDSSSSPPGAAPAPAGAPAEALDSSRLRELQEALEREKTRGLDLAHQLASLQQEYDAATSRQASDAASAESRIADLQASLQQAQERSETAARQLASVQEELRSVQALREQDAASATSRVTELQASLDQEKARGDSSAQQLASLQEQYRALQAQQPGDADAARKISELQNAVQQEREDRDAAARQLASVQEELRSVQTLKDKDAEAATSRIAEMQQSLAQEKARGDTASQQLASLQEQYRGLQAQQKDQSQTARKVADLQASLQQAQERSETAARQLAGVQEELRSVQAVKEKDAAAATSRITEMQETLAREKVRGDAVTRELADAIDLIDELRTARERLSQGPAPLMLRLETDRTEPPLAPASSDPSPPAVQSTSVTGTITPPSDRASAAREIASALPLSELDLAAPASPAQGAQSQFAALPHADQAKPAPKAEQPPASTSADDRLLARADELIRRGDVSGARLLLERSMEDGNARAAFRLAETFDPTVLSRLGVLGIRGDVAKARALYERARSLGIAQAAERMEALK